ncbi:MAG: hypothetical protein M3174_08060 [Actinomycetota bacterium]|nr:hypothetical protein [Actinomycetota bacterium]
MAGGRRQGTRARRAVIVTLVALALVAGATAHAGQTSAAKSPRLQGPIRELNSHCPAKERARHEGKVIAVLEMCLWIYELDRAAPYVSPRNFGVGWLQTTVNPVNGWCATKVESTLTPQGSEIEESTWPRRQIRANKRTRMTARVTTDADGSSLENASVAQSFTLFPRTLTPTVRNGTLKTTWKGKESSTLAFVVGAEISWDAAATPGLRGGLGGMSFIKKRGC